MRKLLATAVMAAGLFALPAQAVHTDTYRIPYLGFGLSYLGADTSRKTDDGSGYQITIGIPLKSSQNKALEISIFDYALTRTQDGDDNFSTGVMLDYVRDYGLLGHSGSFLRAKPYWLVGGGFAEEDSFGEKNLHLSVNAGAGFYFPTRFYGWGIRTEARIRAELNDETCATSNLGTGVCTETVSTPVTDYMFTVGLQIPLAWFFDRDIPITNEPECEVRVVNADSGRSDCAADSDRDGVADPRDQCPSTPPATAVDAVGCPIRLKTTDADGDGVVDADDKCPGTAKDLSVDADGCVVTQNVSIYGVTFELDSAELTAEGRQTLNGVATSLNNQPSLRMEVAGHTDNIGSPAYNLVLSQQRADTVRNYLMDKGVGESRMTAVGYGQNQPVADNDTEEGRAQNRRVEFRIVTR